MKQLQTELEAQRKKSGGGDAAEMCRLQGRIDELRKQDDLLRKGGMDEHGIVHVGLDKTGMLHASCSHAAHRQSLLPHALTVARVACPCAQAAASR